MSAMQTEGKITALYERLSRDDDQAGDSSSIVNQKRYLEDYAVQHGFTNLRHYTDDGWSGGNFDRPDWKRLVADIEAGMVAAVIVKDMSRVGRNYLQTGFYTEVYFREHGVRFIAIANCVDNEDQDSNEFAPFLNIVNEWYLRDQSRKVAAAYKVKGNAGKPITNNAIYGYKKDPENKDHWLIDEEAAAVVRRIFRLAVDGYGPYDIARILTAEKVECPAYYEARNNRGAYKKRIDLLRPHDWYGYTVAAILSKPEYMGHTVNFRSSKKSYKDKREKKEPEDWLIFENTHEAIVDFETWKLAQQIRRAKHRIDADGEPNPFIGLCFCADCGGKMYIHRGRRQRADSTEYITEGFNCSTYTLSREHEVKECFSHGIAATALRTLTLDAIRTASKYAIENEAEFTAKVRAAAEVRKQEEAKELRRRIGRTKKRIAELDVLIRKLYESFAMGKLTEDRYDLLSVGYEQEQAEMKAALAADEAEMDRYDADTVRVDQFLALAKKYTDFTELTAQMVNEFIEKIIVYKSDRDEYEDRCQELDIYFNFIGKFEVPAQEPTPEELAEEEAQRKKRATNRHRYAKKKEREQMIRDGLIAPGEPFTLTCECCGKPFESMRSSTRFCGHNCRAKHYRQQKTEERSRECACENCGKTFTTTRIDVKYCCEECRYQAKIKRQTRTAATVENISEHAACLNEEQKTA